MPRIAFTPWYAHLVPIFPPKCHFNPKGVMTHILQQLCSQFNPFLLYMCHLSFFFFKSKLHHSFHLSNLYDQFIDFFSLPKANQDISRMFRDILVFPLKIYLASNLQFKNLEREKHTHKINERPLCTPLKLLQFLWYIPSQIPVRFLWCNAHKRILQKDKVLDGYWGGIIQSLTNSTISILSIKTNPKVCLSCLYTSTHYLI